MRPFAPAGALVAQSTSNIRPSSAASEAAARRINGAASDVMGCVAARRPSGAVKFIIRPADRSAIGNRREGRV